MIFPHLSNTIEYSYNFYALRHLINIMNSFAVYYISPKFFINPSPPPLVHLSSHFIDLFPAIFTIH